MNFANSIIYYLIFYSDHWRSENRTYFCCTQSTFPWNNEMIKRHLVCEDIWKDNDIYPNIEMLLRKFSFAAEETNVFMSIDGPTWRFNQQMEIIIIIMRLPIRLAEFAPGKDASSSSSSSQDIFCCCSCDWLLWAMFAHVHTESRPSRISIDFSASATRIDRPPLRPLNNSNIRSLKWNLLNIFVMDRIICIPWINNCVTICGDRLSNFRSENKQRSVN